MNGVRPPTDREVGGRLGLAIPRLAVQAGLPRYLRPGPAPRPGLACRLPERRDASRIEFGFPRTRKQKLQLKRLLSQAARSRICPSRLETVLSFQIT